MKLRNLNPRKEKWKYFHIFTSSQVFEKVYCCVIDRTIWFNGKDGYFYSYVKNKKFDDKYIVSESQNEISATCRTLKFVTDNMRTGYNMTGMPICHRKNYFGRHRNPLRGATIVNKGKKGS